MSAYCFVHSGPQQLRILLAVPKFSHHENVVCALKSSFSKWRVTSIKWCSWYRGVLCFLHQNVILLSTKLLDHINSILRYMRLMGYRLDISTSCPRRLKCNTGVESESIMLIQSPALGEKKKHRSEKCQGIVCVCVCSTFQKTVFFTPSATTYVFLEIVRQ